jgi:hypothetical protein
MTMGSLRCLLTLRPRVCIGKVGPLRRLASAAEALNRSQLVTGSQKHRDPRFPLYAFTEHGAMMAAMILTARALWRRACMSCALSWSCGSCWPALAPAVKTTIPRGHTTHGGLLTRFLQPVQLLLPVTT